MPQGYYTLQEAAQFLGMSVDELKQMAQKGQIRSFQDRGNLRFRTQDVEELGRRRGGSSEPDLALGGSGVTAPKSAATPPSGSKKAPASPKSPARKDAPEVFDFAFEGDNVDIGADLIAPKSGPKSKGGPRSAKKPATPQVPTAGSDSDVRLVADGSDVTFSVPKDSDIKLVDSDVTKGKAAHPSSGAKRPSQLALGSDAKPGAPPSSGSKRGSPKPVAAPQPVDSGVRLVPMDSDSDVKLTGSSDHDVPLGESGESSPGDSNVRLEKVKLPPADSGEGSMHLTEEINLDEEIQKEQEKEKQKGLQAATRLKPKSELKLPTDSPFELSEADLQITVPTDDSGPKTPLGAADSEQADSSDFELSAQEPERDSGSDFDLVPADDGTVLLEGDSSDFSLEASSGDEQVLEEQRTELTSSSSGISLDNPADEGISLEGEESDDFDLSLEVEDTPRPSKSRPAEDSDGDFELSAENTPRPTKLGAGAADSEEFDLSLDSDSQGPALEEQKDDSQFELNLQGSDEGEISADSDSEFELTLDDSGNLEAVGDEEAAPQVKSKKPKAGEEQDIFETDFEVPALDESDDATVADSELESSDFDLALDDSELVQDEESGSQVVALDEEEAETLADSDDAAVVDDVEVEEESSDFADLDADVQVEDVEVEAPEPEIVVQERLIRPAPWGVMPVIFMLPCVIVMMLVGLLGYELITGIDGRKPPGPLTVGIGSMIGVDFKK